MPKLNFKTTADIKVPKTIANQVIGQDKGVNIIRKAAQQRRHVLLIGEPGTGKSMLGLALAEMLPKEKLVDIVAFPNPNDENAPLIRTVPANQGRDLVAKAKIQGIGGGNQNMILMVLVIIAMIVPYWVWRANIFNLGETANAIIYAASMVTFIIIAIGFMFSMSVGKRMAMGGKPNVPKLIVDNFKKKQAPFFDATGAHAGALLGDVLHDPFQTFLGEQYLKKNIDGTEKKVLLNTEIDTLFSKHKENILRKQKKNYEAIFLDKDELYVQGEQDGVVSPVEVLSSNRYDHDGEMIKITTSEKKELIVTPEHKIAVWKNDKIAYIEAKDIKETDEIVCASEDIIIDEQDIINTYDERQQEQCRFYYQYLDTKGKNPTWGYKRIAKFMEQKEGKTRWWHAKKHIPVPIQTCNWLKEKGLLPLKIDNKNLPLIAKVLGTTFGDGGIFENLNGIFLSSSELDAVKEFGEDIEKVFKLKSDVNSRIIEGGEYGHSWCYQNTNRNLIRFFLALGAPKGNKTNLELKIPSWIKNKPEFEHEFYGSFFGGELGTPTIHKQGNYLTSLEIGITGTSELKENRINFLNEIIKYLEKNRIKVTSIYEGKTKTDSMIFRMLIEKKIDNVLLFLMNTKINYCNYKKNRLYLALGQWAMLKKNKYNELLSKGYGAEHAMKVLNLSPNSLYLLLNHFGQKEEATS